MKTYKLPNSTLQLYIYDRSDIKGDRIWIKEHQDELYAILKTGYDIEAGGCFIYRSPKKLFEMASLCKVVKDENNVIYAVATYRYYPLKNSYKAILGTYNHDLHDVTQAKYAIKCILKSDIVNATNKLYWIETSDSITKIMQKYGGTPIPACFVPAILDDPEIIIDSNDALNDPYVYYKKISDEQGFIKKYIFGFDSRETCDMMLKHTSAYEYEQELIKRIGHELYNYLKEDLSNVQHYDKLWNALNYIENMYFEHNGFHDITRSCLKIINALLVDTYDMIRSGLLTIKKRDSLESLYLNVKDIINSANILSPHRLI